MPVHSDPGRTLSVLQVKTIAVDGAPEAHRTATENLGKKRGQVHATPPPGRLLRGPAVGSTRVTRSTPCAPRRGTPPKANSLPACLRARVPGTRSCPSKQGDDVTVGVLKGIELVA